MKNEKKMKKKIIKKERKSERYIYNEKNTNVKMEKC